MAASLPAPTTQHQVRVQLHSPNLLCVLLPALLPPDFTAIWSASIRDKFKLMRSKCPDCALH